MIEWVIIEPSLERRSSDSSYDYPTQSPAERRDNRIRKRQKVRQGHFRTSQVYFTVYILDGNQTASDWRTLPVPNHAKIVCGRFVEI